jgi:Fe-S-cluster containining protein
MTVCTDCGACCAAFRVSFYWAETEARQIPTGLVQKLNPWMCCMTGSNSDSPRCNALKGTIGHTVKCEIYELRPEPCREVQPGDDQCNRARKRHGLPELLPERSTT